MSDDGVDFRAMMSDYWTSQWKNVKFPKKGSASTVFDYYLDPKTCGLGVLELQLREDGVDATRERAPTQERLRALGQEPLLF